MRFVPVAMMSLALSGGAIAHPLAAQSPSKLSPDSVLARLVSKPQARIRIRLATGRMVELRRPRIEGAMLVGQSGYGAATEYPLQELTQVWRRGSAVDLGFAIGAGIGFVGGAAAGVALANMCIFSCSSPSRSEEIAAALLGGVVGGVAIGAVGALFAVAAPAQRWKSVFKAQGPRVTPIITGSRFGVSLSF